MHTRTVVFAGALLALSACSHSVRETPERFSFDMQFSPDAKHCSVEATDLHSKAVLSVEVYTVIGQKSNDASYEDLGSGQSLTVELIHEESGAHRCRAQVREHGQVVASDSREL